MIFSNNFLPAYSPCAPELGWKLIASKFVTPLNQ